MKSSRSELILSFSSILILFTMLILPAEATESDDISTEDFEWTTLVGDDLKNNPLVEKILKNIEISKQRIAELQQNQFIKTEHEKFIDEQRRISQEKLQVELDRMFKKYEDFTPRNAFAKYLAHKIPEKYHEMYWELFDYLQEKIQNARDAKAVIIRNGGSYAEARQAFIDIAAMPMSEKTAVLNKTHEKYGFVNMAGKFDLGGNYSDEAKALYASWTNTKSNEIPITKTTFDYSLIKEIPEQSIEISDIIESQQGEIFAIETDPINDFSLVEFQSDDTLLMLDGGNYVMTNLDSMNNVSEFTLSAWVKPDYSQGSIKFTILSTADAFSLSINNNPFYKRTAEFSIFNGIKWTTIESSSEIEEEWVHIAATLTDSSISIYIDGKLEGTKQVDGILSLNSFGYYEPKSVENLSSEHEIVVGAHQYVKKGTLYYKGYFSGLVDDVIVEEQLLDDDQITDLCEQSEYFSA